MSYATQTHLEDAFGSAEIKQIADRDLSGTADPAFIAAALARADAVIDSYLAGRYAIPITPAPSVIVAVACDLARYYLYDDAAPERVQKAHDDAIAWLKSCAKGDVMVIGADSATADQATPGPPAYDAPDRVFSATTLANY